MNPAITSKQPTGPTVHCQGTLRVRKSQGGVRAKDDGRGQVWGPGVSQAAGQEPESGAGVLGTPISGAESQAWECPSWFLLLFFVERGIVCLFCL